MQPSFEEVEKLAQALPEEERIRLANSLSESVAAEEQASEAELEAAWGDEIKRRLDEIDSGKVKMIPHDEFLAYLNAHIARKPRE